MAAIRAVVAGAFDSDVQPALVERIRASPEHLPELALVAVQGDRIVGHVMVSHATLRTAAGDRPIAMLSPLAVAPPQQRQGIGSALVRAALAAAEERGEPMVILEGSPAYYGRLGFEPAARHGIAIPLPSWASPAAGQVARLAGHRADEPRHQGQVAYPAAFDGLE